MSVRLDWLLMPRKEKCSLCKQKRWVKGEPAPWTGSCIKGWGSRIPDSQPVWRREAASRSLILPSPSQLGAQASRGQRQHRSSVLAAGKDTSARLSSWNSPGPDKRGVLALPPEQSSICSPSSRGPPGTKVAENQLSAGRSPVTLPVFPTKTAATENAASGPSSGCGTAWKISSSSRNTAYYCSASRYKPCGCGAGSAIAAASQHQMTTCSQRQVRNVILCCWFLVARSNIFDFQSAPQIRTGSDQGTRLPPWPLQVTALPPNQHFQNKGWGIKMSLYFALNYIKRARCCLHAQQYQPSPAFLSGDSCLSVE